VERAKIAVLASGNGSNLQAMIDAVDSGRINAEIAVVISDIGEANALRRARKAGIKAVFADPGEFRAADEFDGELMSRLERCRVKLVCLAGYMRILTPAFVRRYKGRIMNIHPALLPAFKGSKAIKDAFEYGVKVTGCTVHFVTEELDSGPVITQKTVTVCDDDTLETLTEKIHEAEHEIYPQAIEWFLEGRLKVDGRKVTRS